MRCTHSPGSGLPSSYRGPPLSFSPSAPPARDDAAVVVPRAHPPAEASRDFHPRAHRSLSLLRLRPCGSSPGARLSEKGKVVEGEGWGGRAFGDCSTAATGGRILRYHRDSARELSSSNAPPSPPLSLQIIAKICGEGAVTSTLLNMSMPSLTLSLRDHTCKNTHFRPEAYIKPPKS